MRRFFVDENIVIGKKLVLPEREARHLRDSLRMRVGNELIVFNDQGEFAAVLDKVTHDFVQVQIVRELSDGRSENIAAGPRITLYMSLIRLPNFELALQKATELGAHRFVPVIAEYSQVRASEFGAQKQARLQKIIIDACKQAERKDIPELMPIVEAEEAIAAANENLKLFFTLNRQTDLSVQALHQLKAEVKNSREVAIFIGPEGGFSASEHKLATENNWVLTSLGEHILRAETAAIAAMSNVNLLLQSDD